MSNKRDSGEILIKPARKNFIKLIVKSEKEVQPMAAQHWVRNYLEQAVSELGMTAISQKEIEAYKAEHSDETQISE